MDLPVSIVTKKITKDSPKVTIYYPVIANMKDKQIQKEINHAIIHTFNQLLIEQNYFNESLVELVANFEIKTNERGILSLNLIVYSYTGGAHGNTVIKSLTFDIKTGKQYTLEELFKPGSNYVTVLSDMIRKDIKKWDIQLLDPPFTKIRPDQDFYIADTSLVIYFQQYELAAYVYGFLYFPIAILNLQDIVAENGPLSRMMSFT